jgi:Ni,Fe-hydrogenase III small subunit/formate hydrogenlyase subunit 6/NADH:ubiquinone oxidoreductase subunit I
MFSILAERFRQGHRTIRFPAGDPPKIPDRFRGLPVVDTAKCAAGCRGCAEACPTDAISIPDVRPRVDLGRCLFCSECVQACPAGAIGFTPNYRLASRSRDGLVVDGKGFPLAEALDAKARRLFGRSLHLRQVSAGGCNACEADINVLSTVVFDLSRFGVQIVASPRHADGLIVTGPVTENMRLALQKTYEATPAPKIVIAVGACAISGGVFAGHPEQHNGVDSTVPVDLYVPGCPPHPLTILDGILRLLGRNGEDGGKSPAANRR